MGGVCDIIIPVWNQPGWTRRCLEALVTGTDFPYRLILIDNGSEVETRTLLTDFCDRLGAQALLIRNGENVGFVKAVNQGLARSSGKYIVILNNDTLAYPGWLSEMIAVAESEPDIGLVNPASNNFKISPEEARHWNGPPYSGLAKAVGFCLLMKREILEEVGFLDEDYGVGFYEDTDLSRRVQRAGYRCVMSRRAYVHHEIGRTFNVRRDTGELMARARTIFCQKWGSPVKVMAFLRHDHLHGEDHFPVCLELFNALADRGVETKIFLEGLHRDAARSLVRDMGRVDHFGVRLRGTNPPLHGLCFGFYAATRVFLNSPRSRKGYQLMVTDDRRIQWLSRGVGRFRRLPSVLLPAPIRDVKGEMGRLLAVIEATQGWRSGG